MDVMDAIYGRRSVRAYTEQPVDKPTIERLIEAATQAPSSMNEQPWAFVVVQDQNRLTKWSDRIKKSVLKRLKPDSPIGKYRDMLADPTYHVFHRAGTLIIICAKPQTHNGKEDCSLAGFARPWLTQARNRRSLSIPNGYVPVFPLVVGCPSGETSSVSRRPPEVLFWE
ncbi:MAG TPA: nitroreductase family protein [Nitrospiraceae bacterium]|nr:nitroreductase family protein [Nitrospiraceae bacterium]